MSVVPLNTIKTAIQSTLNTANTTTASPLDLSNGLENRVTEIMTVNPELIPISATRLPAVTIWLDAKDIDHDTIATNQLQAKRKCTLTFKIAAVVFRSLVDDYRTDLADDEAALLMENIEEVLRNNPNLSGNVLWQVPTGATYHNVALAEETAMRVGIMSLDVVTRY